MRKTNQYVKTTDFESLDILDNIFKVIKKGREDKVIPDDWYHANIKRFEAVEKSLLEPHTEEYSESVYNQLRKWVINFEKAYNKSKV